MFESTRAIVFQTVKYSDTSVIVKIYTETAGILSFMVKGVHGKRSRIKQALFQPLHLLHIHYNRRDNKTLLHLKEAHLAVPYQTIPYDMVKRSVLLFLNEVLLRSVKEETADDKLFEWIWKALVWYDLARADAINFHLLFLYQLTKFLGFYPRHPEHAGFLYFDLQEGEFVGSEPPHPHYTGKENARLLWQMASVSFNNLGQWQLKNEERRKLLNLLTTYYRLHVASFGELKSLDVLRTLF